MLADWFEAYAWAMEINVWTSTEFVGGTYDEAAGTLEGGGAPGRRDRAHSAPRHLIFANGVSGLPAHSRRCRD